MSQIHDLASGRLAASAFLALAIAHGSATAQYQAFVDEATKISFNIPKQENTDRCNIQISTQGSQPIEQVVEGPNFSAVIELTPNQVGDISINWVGKTRFRGLRSVVGCVGQGQIIVSVVPSTPQIEAAWAKVFSEMTTERRECVEIGLTRFSIKWQASNPVERIVGPYHESVMPIYQRCDRFDRAGRVWKQWQSLPGANGSQFNYPCVIEGKSTRCDGFYAERMPSGELNEISRTAAITNHMAGRSWTTGQRENNEARIVREASEAKAETERKKAEAERILARAEADRLKQIEDERLRVQRERDAVEARLLQEKREAEAARLRAEQEVIEKERRARAEQEAKIAQQKREEAEAAAQREREKLAIRQAEEARKKRQAEEALLAEKVALKNKLQAEGKKIWIEDFQYTWENLDDKLIRINYKVFSENMLSQRLRGVKGCLGLFDKDGSEIEMKIFALDYNEPSRSSATFGDTDILSSRNAIQISQFKAFFVRIINDCDERKSESNILVKENKISTNTPARSQPEKGDAFSAWIEGNEYIHYSDGSCKAGGKQVCIDAATNELACKSASGYTRGFYSEFCLLCSTRNEAILALRRGNLDIQWSRNRCQASGIFSGAFRGTDYNLYLCAEVTTYLITKDRKILAHRGHRHATNSERPMFSDCNW